LRNLEFALLSVTVAAVLWPAVFGVRPRRGVIAALLAAAAGLQLQVEGFRWQMALIHLAGAGLAVGDIIFIDRRVEWSHRVARGLFGLFGLSVAAAAPVAFPVPELPAPSGPETIGTTTVELVDEGRPEVYGAFPGAPRRLTAQVWYPARPDSGQAPAPWSEDWDVVAPATAERLGLPSWFLNHTRYTRSNGLASARPAEGPFPVVVYSHRWAGFRAIGINQVETLASNGYIVIAVDHTYAAAATRLSDGEVVRWDPAALPEEGTVPEEERDEAGRVLLETLAADLVTVLDALERGGAGPLGSIAEKADLARIGLFGHGVGGGAAVRVCLEDPRCGAVLGMDPWVAPLPDSTIKLTASKPALHMRSDDRRGTDNDALLRGIAERSEAPTYWLGVEGAGHNDFTAVHLLSPIASRLGLKGPIPAGRVMAVIDNYLLGFFDVYLLGAGPAALDAVTFEEVSVEVING